MGPAAPSHVRACTHQRHVNPLRLQEVGSDGGRSLWTVGSVHKDFGRVIMSMLWIGGSVGRKEKERSLAAT